MTRARIFFLVVGVAVLALVWIWASGSRVALDAQATAERIRAAGAWGPAALFGLLVVQCVVAPLPSEPLMMAAGFLYGRGTGFAIGWLGVLAGACACFVLARRFGRPFVERFVREDRLRALDAYAADRGRWATFLAVLGLRVFSFTSFDVVSYGCGLIRFPLPWFLLATAIGSVPKVFAFTYAGVSGAEGPGWLGTLILVGTFGVLLLGPWLFWRRKAA